MRKKIGKLALVAPLSMSLGCVAYSNVQRDIERTPTINTGAGATVLMPGQSAPLLPPEAYMNAPPGVQAAPGQPYGAGGAPAAAPYAGAAAPGYAQPGVPAPGYGTPGMPGGPPIASSPNISFIGGADQDVKRHDEFRQDPLIVKALLAPLAAVAYPFKKAYEALQGDPEPVVVPEAAQAPPRSASDFDSAYEEAQLRELERQLSPAGGAPAPSRAPQAYAPQGAAPAPLPSTAGANRARPSSISDELAVLRNQIAPKGQLASLRPAESGAAPQRKAVADRVGDRDRDGRPDHWQYRDGETLVRELFDEDGDGRVDRTVRYDAASGSRNRIEEDADRDGRVDSWVEYRAGAVHRRRADTDGDGEPDAWTFYRAGEIARHEQDRDGDGFRDRISFYDAGQLVRETEDRSGDGRPDQITWYDGAEQPKRRDEDRDGDGVVDVRSFYEDGRLARRELVDEGAAEEAIEEDPLRSEGWFSDGEEAPTAETP